MRSQIKELKHGENGSDSPDYSADYFKIRFATRPTIFIGALSPLWGKQHFSIPSQAIIWKDLDATLKPDVSVLKELSENMIIVIPAEMCQQLAAIDAVVTDEEK